MLCTHGVNDLYTHTAIWYYYIITVLFYNGIFIHFVLSQPLSGAIIYHTPFVGINDIHEVVEIYMKGKMDIIFV